MTIPKLSTNKILIIGLLLVAGVGAYLFLGKSEEPPLTTTEDGVSSGTIGQELVVELTRLRGLQNIRGDIFKDPVFMSLQDYTQTVVAQPLGRSNPFAPIGGN
jgi:hypothetical protein